MEGVCEAVTGVVMSLELVNDLGLVKKQRLVMRQLVGVAVDCYHPRGLQPVPHYLQLLMV